MYIIAGGDIESQLCLRDEMIYDLKQRMASLTEEKDNTIFELTSENEWLKSLLGQALVVEEGILSIYYI